MNAVVEQWCGTEAQMKMCEVNLVDMVDAGLPTISTLKKTYGSKLVLAVVTSHLVSIFNFAGISVSNDQAVELTSIIASYYGYLNLAEIAKYFSELKAGKYGQFIWGGNVNVQQITVGLNSFSKERNKAIEIKERAKEKPKNIASQGISIVQGIEEYKRLKSSAKKEYASFRALFPRMYKDDKYNNKIWRAWKGEQNVFPDKNPTEREIEEALIELQKKQ